MSNRISSIGSTAYLGNNSVNPPNWFINKRSPTTKDNKNYVLGDLWLNRITNEAWMLTSLAGDLASHGVLLAIWSKISKNIIATFTGNSGGPVSPDSLQNINVVGDGTDITIVGNAGINTLTLSATSGSLGNQITGNSGGAVSPESNGNINIVGDGITIEFIDSPSTNTITASILNPTTFHITGNDAQEVFPDLSGNINLIGDGISIDVTGNPGSHTLTLSLIPSDIPHSITGDTGGAVSSGAGNNIDLIGGVGITTVGTSLSHSIEIQGSSVLATLFDTDSGSAVPSAGIIAINGSSNINTSGSGNTITVDLDSSLTGITNLTIDNLTVTNSADFSYLTEGVLQSDGSGTITSSEGTDGQTLISSSTGAPAWASLTAGSNISIINGSNSITVSKSTAGGNGWVHIATGGLGDYTTGITADYKTLLIVIEKISYGAMGPYNILCQISDNGGISYYNSNYLSGLNRWDVRQIAPPGLVNRNTTDAFMCGYINNATVVGHFGSGSYYLYDVNTTNPNKLMVGGGISHDNGARFTVGFQASGVYNGPLVGRINALRFSLSGTPILFYNAVISIYGLTS